MDFSNMPVDVLRIMQQYRGEIDHAAKYKHVMMELKRTYFRTELVIRIGATKSLFLSCGSYHHSLYFIHGALLTP